MGSIILHEIEKSADYKAVPRLVGKLLTLRKQALRIDATRISEQDCWWPQA